MASVGVVDSLSPVGLVGSPYTVDSSQVGPVDSSQVGPGPGPGPGPVSSPPLTSSSGSPISTIRTKSRSDSSCSASSDYTFDTDYSNGSISSPSIENFEAFQVIDNPTDANTATRLVLRSRLEELEYMNENISAIILEAINNFRG